MKYELIALVLFFLWMAYKDYQIFRLKRDLADMEIRQAKQFELALERDSEIITSIFIADWPEHKTPESVRQAFDNIVTEQTAPQSSPD